jgi:hypothetical protein
VPLPIGSIKFLNKLKENEMYYYFKNTLYRNVHVYEHIELEPEYQGKWVVAFQTNNGNDWYYLNDLPKLGQMTQATKATRFDNPKKAYYYMQDMLKDLTYQGVEKIFY